jgi:hypothetical protein
MDSVEPHVREYQASEPAFPSDVKEEPAAAALDPRREPAPREVTAAYRTFCGT